VIKVGGFSEDILIANAEDYHLWLKLIMDKNFFWGSDQVLASYRVLSNSSTGNDKLASNKLPFVYSDLIKSYPEFKITLSNRLKNLFKFKYKYEIAHFIGIGSTAVSSFVLHKFWTFS
jgi:hypothetical protein